MRSGDSFKVVEDNSGVVAAHMSLLPDSKLLLSERFREIPAEWLGPTFPSGVPNALSDGNVTQQAWASQSPYYKPNANLNGFLTDTAQYDTAAGTFEMIKYPALTTNEGYAYGNGAAQMADGGILVAGGDQKWNLSYDGVIYNTDGRRDIRTFKDGVYEKIAEMNWDNINSEFSGRWYPTSITLPDENVMILGGHHVEYSPNEPRANSPSYEILHTASAVTAVDPPTNVSLLQFTFPVNANPLAQVLPWSSPPKVFAFAGNRSSIISYTDHTEWALPSLPDDGVYPRSFPFAGTHFLLPLTPANNYTATVWVCGGVKRSATPDGPDPQWCSNCSQCKASEMCYSIAPETGNPTWTGEAMPEGRAQSMAVNLPDGTIAIFGGSSIGHQGGNAGIPIGETNPPKRAILFDPYQTDSSKRWLFGATATVARQYHSTALLLPDASVVLGGSDDQDFANDQVNPYELRLERYYPAYFALQDRLNINLTSVLATVGYGQKFILPFTSQSAQTIKMVSMIRFGTSKAAVNVDQRMVGLVIVHWGVDKMYVESPPNANIAPPGNYMLWAMDNRGAPVMQAATVNVRTGNWEPDATWDSGWTVQPKSSTGGSPLAPGDAGSGAREHTKGHALAIAAAVTVSMVSFVI
ncbi:hypothetical protein HKX48_006586 [Thoreauomyces humboldtii]|nr:hypothetical protein HKX48_006586 [Thoreauomyces humboldtii]